MFDIPGATPQSTTAVTPRDFGEGYDMSSEDRGSSLIFFMFGAAIGAGMGVLFAPKAGKDTREQLGDWLKEKREEGNELLSRVKGEGGELLSRVKEEGLHKKDAITAAYKAGKQAYAETEKHI